MGNKALGRILLILILVCIAGALATLVAGIVLGLSISSEGVTPNATFLCAGLSLGLALLGGSGTLLLWLHWRT